MNLKMGILTRLVLGRSSRDHSGDDYGDAPDADEVETEADSPPPTSNNKSGRKRGLSGRFECGIPEPHRVII